MDIFHRAIRHQQSIFMVEILSVAGRLIDDLSYGNAVFRMGALDNKFRGRLRRPVTSKDSEGLLRPNHLARGDVPADASRATQFLCLGQIRLALLQSTFRPLAVGHVDDKGNPFVWFPLEK